MDFKDHFKFEPRYGILICKSCAFAVPPRHLRAHIAKRQDTPRQPATLPSWRTSRASSASEPSGHIFSLCFLSNYTTKKAAMNAAVAELDANDAHDRPSIRSIAKKHGVDRTTLS
jgi:hypothetical protein